MKSIVAIVFIGAFVAMTSAGFGYYPGYSAYSALPAAVTYSAPLAAPYAYQAYSGVALGQNYKLGLDTSLPGSAYASYPYAAAPTAYGYGVYKAL